MNLYSTDTICAIITPPGNSALGGVRISGSEAQSIAAAIFSPYSSKDHLQVRASSKGRVKLLFSPHSITNETNEVEIETDCFIYSFIAPHSYTCEDIIEIFIPGSPAMLQALLRIITRRGARFAEAGEFTLRAFLNGRLSLGEAESVERIIHAQTENQRQQAINRLEGSFEKQIKRWKDELLFIAGTIETVIDFEDENIEADIEKNLKNKLKKLAEEAEAIAKNSRALHKPEDSYGARIILAGLTNSGKSSLLNAMLTEDRAIISPERSTTRDHTEHSLKINEIEFIIEDCPGIDIEKTIIADGATLHAKNRFQACNILALIIDGSTNNYVEVDELLSHIPRCRAIVVFNKSDLPQLLEKSRVIEQIEKKAEIIDTITLSALTGNGIEKLISTIYNEGLIDSSTSSGVGISAREEEELFRASHHAREAIDVFEMGTELAAVELRESYEAMARLGGDGYAEDILGNIFSRFCVGK